VITMTRIRRNSAGFTLIEVMISMIVLSLGLLGLAALETKTLRDNQNAYYRSLASQFAYELADRMRVNNAEAKKTTSKYYLDPDQAQSQPTCESAPGCSPIFMAEHDLFQWNSLITDALPMSSGIITKSGGAFLITIQWDENRDGDPSNDASFQVSFKL
jgi:type IV pilus assembly protein PilV